MWGEVFEKIKEISYFKKASIDKTSGTIVWQNGVDIAPETLYKRLVTNCTPTTANQQITS